MPVITELKEQLIELSTFKDISVAFTEASAVKIRKIRAMFEENRQFYDEISYLYHLVRLSAARQHIAVSPAAAGTGKAISVAVTSNLRFYGVINVDIIKTFLDESEKKHTGRIVIGSTGIDYIKSMRYKNDYETITFTKDNPTAMEITAFLEKVKDYDKVFLYYPKFVSLLFQSVGVMDITLAEMVQQPGPEENIHVIFEPELPKILAFFQTQVRALLFQRVMLETDLARTAARLLTMSAAEERTQTLINEQKLKLRKLTSSFINAQLLEIFAGMKKWKQ